MKLRKLHIEDYKMFKDFDISFVDENDEALPIVVLAGVNGSGKTTLLEYLGTCNYEKDVEDKDIENNIEIIKQENGYIEIIKKDTRKIVLDDYRKESPILRDIEINDGADNIKIIQQKESSVFPAWLSRKTQHVAKDRLTIAIMSDRVKIVYFPSGIDDTKEVANEFVKTFYDFLKNHDYRPSEVKEHFHNYMMDIFDGIELTFKYSHLDKEDNVWFTNNEGQEFQIDKLSTGEKTLLSKILYMYFKDYKDKVILIDEPELSLHPSWQNKILSIYEKLAEKNNCQIIIATHSPQIIGSAKNEYLRILRKNDDGNIEVIDNSMAYGRDIEWVLEEVMGTQYTREKNILLKIEECQDLIEDEDYDKAEEAIDNLEAIIGRHDKEVSTLRNSLAFERMNLEEDN